MVVKTFICPDTKRESKENEKEARDEYFDLGSDFPPRRPVLVMMVFAFEVFSFASRANYVGL